MVREVVLIVVLMAVVWMGYKKIKVTKKKMRLRDSIKIYELVDHPLDIVDENVKTDQELDRKHNLTMVTEKKEACKMLTSYKNRLAKQVVTQILSDHAFFQCRVIHNFLFYGEIDGKLESFRIDHILITPRSLIILESKNEQNVTITPTRNDWIWKYEREKEIVYDLSEAKLNEQHLNYVQLILNGNYLAYSLITYVGENCMIKYFGTSIICSADNLKLKLRELMANDYFYNEPFLPIGLLYDNLEDVNVSGIEKYEKAHRLLLEEKKEKLNLKNFRS